MLFNSYTFIVFFIIVICSFFTIPHRFRWLLLLIASYVFYMWWNAVYGTLILICTLVNFFGARRIHDSITQAQKRKWLAVSLVSSLGLLGVFKYFDFANDTLRWILSLLHVEYVGVDLGLMLPVGISFYTFQALSYTIEVYWGKHPPERHMGRFALYVSFFPQLVAGPIERPARLLPQLARRVNFNYDRIRAGLKLMLFGYFKKMVVADNLAIVVNTVYDNPQQFEGMALIIATVFFAFQIYCDFSGYSDIAIGAARILGVDLMENFNRPYQARSMSEFWSRWHISLSTWFRDYLYIPLGGNRVRLSRTYLNLMVTFLISGLWHGAHWKFVFWGGLNGLYLVGEKLTAPLRQQIVAFLELNKVPRLLGSIQVTTTFALTCLAWVFFRANNMDDAYYIVTHMHVGLASFVDRCFSDFVFTMRLPLISSLTRSFAITNYHFVVMIIAIVSLTLVDIYSPHKGERDRLQDKPIWLRWSFYYFLIGAILFYGQADVQQFIYFQF